MYDLLMYPNSNPPASHIKIPITRVLKMDRITLNRIRLLHPKVREEALAAYTYCNQKLLGNNVLLRFSHTLRSIDEQNSLYAIGRTKLFDAHGNRLAKVTNARGGQSIHNYGLAFDIVLLIDKDNNGAFETASWNTTADNDSDSVADWREITAYLKKQGWSWGGDWKSLPDYPHFEKTFGYTSSSLLTNTMQEMCLMKLLTVRFING
jgi:peptidoglycan L-alanyl-D-glutamate endopeptidase CwlK